MQLPRSRPRKVVRTSLKKCMWHQWFNRDVMKLRKYFLCAKKAKIMNLFMRVPQRMRMHSYACEQVTVHACFTLECWLLRQKHHMYASWYSCEWQRTDAEKKKSFNIVVILVFFEHKTYSHSFIKLRLNHWCHMDYFNNVFITFLGLECGSWVAQKALGFYQKYLNLCSNDEWSSYGLERHEDE